MQNAKQAAFDALISDASPEDVAAILMSLSDKLSEMGSGDKKTLGTLIGPDHADALMHHSAIIAAFA